MKKDITLSIPEKDYPFFITLIRKLDFVEVKKSKNSRQAKKDFLEGFKEAIDELNQVKAGKLKGIPAKDLLNEL